LDRFIRALDDLVRLPTHPTPTLWTSRALRSSRGSMSRPRYTILVIDDDQQFLGMAVELLVIDASRSFCFWRRGRVAAGACGPPALLVVSRELEVIALTGHADSNPSDTGPGVEPGAQRVERTVVGREREPSESRALLSGVAPVGRGCFRNRQKDQFKKKRHSATHGVAPFCDSRNLEVWTNARPKP